MNLSPMTRDTKFILKLIEKSFPSLWLRGSLKGERESLSQRIVNNVSIFSVELAERFDSSLWLVDAGSSVRVALMEWKSSHPRVIQVMISRLKLNMRIFIVEKDLFLLGCTSCCEFRGVATVAHLL